MWECLSPEGFALNSKWSDAEKYISNPLSGQVPMECLSAKTLSARSFRNMMTNRITMSAPLIYSASSHLSYYSIQTNNKLASSNPQENVLQIPIQGSFQLPFCMFNQSPIKPSLAVLWSLISPLVFCLLDFSEKKVVRPTRDVGVQSTLADLKSRDL